MSVTIHKGAALRAALDIRAKEEYQAAFTWIKLEPPKEGAEFGRMIATDGYSLLLSEDAHDSPELVYWRPTSKWTLPKTVATVELEGDTLRFHKHNGAMDVKPIETRDADAFSYPDVDRVIPADDAPRVPLCGPVDSIRGGRIAKAYGTHHGAWVPMPGGKMAYLWGTEPGDLVVLVPLRDVDAWVTEAEA